MRKRWLQLGLGHVSYTITVNDLKRWVARAGLREITIFTQDVYLWSLPTEMKFVEKMLRFHLSIILRLLRPLNLGDDIICVAKKVS
jgi:hypothetical protein